MEYQTKGAAAGVQGSHEGADSANDGPSARGEAQELLRADTREGYVEEGMLLKEEKQLGKKRLRSLDAHIAELGRRGPTPDVVAALKLLRARREKSVETSDDSYDAYRALPEEHEAHDQQDDVKKQLDLAGGP